MESRIKLFDLVSDNLIHEIADFVGPPGILNLARTSKFALRLFDSSAFQSKYKISMFFFKKVLDFAALGKWVSLDNILEIFPEFLLLRGTIYHPGRYRYSDCTIWEIALMNDEGDNEDVFKIFKKHFQRLQNGLGEMATQFFNVFPEGVIKKYWDGEKAKKLCSDVFKACGRSNIHIETILIASESKLKTFRDYITPKPSDSFKKGLVFDPQLCLHLLDIRNARGAPSYYHELFYMREVWDYLYRLFPTSYLRVSCQGIGSIIRQHQPLTIDGCTLKSGERFLPLDSDSKFQFGTHFINYEGKRKFTGDEILKRDECFLRDLILLKDIQRKKLCEAMWEIKNNMDQDNKDRKMGPS